MFNGIIRNTGKINTTSSIYTISQVTGDVDSTFKNNDPLSVQQSIDKI